jgi:hypothetical protein
MLSVFLFVSTTIGVLGIARNDVYQESDFSSKAIFRVPDSAFDIILERRNVHLFLAEYERTLVLRFEGKEVVRQKAADDTGGYSRMNVFQLSDHEYFLVGEFSFDSYLLDISRTSLLRLEQRDNKRGSFVGSFDRDEKGWRFIPVGERGIQKNLL